jgi:type IV secretion system protein VirB8
MAGSSRPRVSAMNDVAPRPRLAGEARGSLWQATAAETADLAAHFKAVESFQAERVRLGGRSRLQAWLVAGVMSAIALAEAVSIAVMLPLQRQVPIPILIQQDGSTEIAWSWRDVMAENKAAVVTAALWFYLRSREGFNATDAAQNYEAVSAMSEKSVREAYQRWFLPSNPESPQLKIGRNGQVNIQYDGSVLSRDTPVARFYYWRIVQMDGAAPQKTHWTATIDYRVNEPVSASSRLFNPQGIVVSSYFAQEDSPK